MYEIVLHGVSYRRLDDYLPVHQDTWKRNGVVTYNEELIILLESIFWSSDGVLTFDQVG